MRNKWKLIFELKMILPSKNLTPDLGVSLAIANLIDFTCSKDNRDESFWRRSSQWTAKASMYKLILLLEYVSVCIFLRYREVVPLSKPNASTPQFSKAVIFHEVFLSSCLYSFHFFFLFGEVQLIYNIILASDVQHGDSKFLQIILHLKSL